MYCVAWSQYRLKCRDLHVLYFWTADSSPTFTDPCRLYFSSTEIKPTTIQTNSSPALLVLTTICTSRSGSAFSIAITTWPLSLASWVPSTYMTTSGVTFLGGAEVSAVWSMRCWYISSSSWGGASCTFACNGTAKSTNKSCHLLNYVAWISGTSGPSTLDKLLTCFLHVWPVYIRSDHKLLTTSYTDCCTSGCRGSAGTCNSSDIV